MTKIQETVLLAFASALCLLAATYVPQYMVPAYPYELRTLDAPGYGDALRFEAQQKYIFEFHTMNYQAMEDIVSLERQAKTWDRLDQKILTLKEAL